MINRKHELEIPIFSRARSYRLYDYKGNRIIDMYQNNGHAILGHKANKLTKMLKNVIAHGLIFDLPSIYIKRIEKLILNYFPSYKSFRIFSNMNEIISVASQYLGKNIQYSDIFDPSLSTTIESEQISFWRPFLTNLKEEKVLTSKVLIPILPFSVGGSPQIICFKEKIDDKSFTSDIISSFLIAGLIRSIFDLKKQNSPQWDMDNKIYATSWHIENIYLSSKLDKENYSKIFYHFLKEGVLLSPYFPGPSIFPADLSIGEIKKIEILLKSVPEVISANQ